MRAPRRLALTSSLVALVVGAALVAVPAKAEATPISVTWSMTLDLTEGTDVLGLDGATLTLAATFAFPQNYLDHAGFAPYVPSTSESLTISGASVSATNGIYHAFGVLWFFPTDFGQILSSDSSLHYIDVNGELLVAGRLFDTISGPNIGDPFSASHFSATVDSLLSFNWSAGEAGARTEYAITSLDVDITGGDAPTAVPEPATLSLVGLGLAGAAVRRRLRRR